ncbi:MAG: hypothetical protein EXR73_12115 [Myxococcales bacterium]|nr:hypothetical protein [Myxococcales bacterium]
MTDDRRKEKVLHTRIPAALELQVKRLAEGLRVPVSNLVRNMIEDAITVATRMRDSVGQPSTTARRAAADHAELAAVYGWQPLTLNTTAPCARCGRSMVPGDDALLGLTDRPQAERLFLCLDCRPTPSPRRAPARKSSPRNPFAKEK